MKNTIIRYGLIAGAIIASLQIISTLIMKSIGFDKVGFDYAFYFGSTYIFLSMSMIFFGVKSFRDTQNEGKLTYLKGLLIGLGIMAFACVAYSLAWLVVYYNFIPNFMNDYANYEVSKLKSSGGTQVDIDNLMKEMEGYKQWYNNPFSIFLITLIEPLPIGLLVVLLTPLILKKK